MARSPLSSSSSGAVGARRSRTPPRRHRDLDPAARPPARPRRSTRPARARPPTRPARRSAAVAGALAPVDRHHHRVPARLVPAQEDEQVAVRSTAPCGSRATAPCGRGGWRSASCSRPAAPRRAACPRRAGPGGLPRACRSGCPASRRPAGPPPRRNRSSAGPRVVSWSSAASRNSSLSPFELEERARHVVRREVGREEIARRAPSRAT